MSRLRPWGTFEDALFRIILSNPDSFDELMALDQFLINEMLHKALGWNTAKYVTNNVHIRTLIDIYNNQYSDTDVISGEYLEEIEENIAQQLERACL